MPKDHIDAPCATDEDLTLMSLKLRFGDRLHPDFLVALAADLAEPDGEISEKRLAGLTEREAQMARECRAEFLSAA